MISLKKLAITASFMLGFTAVAFAQGAVVATENRIVIDETKAVTFTAPTDGEAIVVAKEDSQEKIDAAFKNLGATPLSIKFLNSCNKLATKIIEENKDKNVWYWSNSHNINTFEKQAASEYKVSNCALFVVWALADMGVFKNNEKFYTNFRGDIVWSNEKSSKVKETLLKYATIIKTKGTADELIKNGTLMPGDICSFDYQHTNAYAGNGMWFDASREGSKGITQNGKHYFTAIYSNVGPSKSKEVNAIIRFKDSEEPAKVEKVAKAEETPIDETQKASTKTNGKTREDFINTLKRISDNFASEYKKGKPWFYSNTGNSNTMAKQLKSGRKCCNCALYVVWALAEMGIYDGNQKFYAHKDGYIKWKNNESKSRIEKYCDIIKVKKSRKALEKSGYLKPGDICCYTIQHTNVYAGNGKWWDAGRRGDTTYVKNGLHYFKKLLSNSGCGETVNYIIRFKE